MLGVFSVDSVGGGMALPQTNLTKCRWLIIISIFGTYKLFYKPDVGHTSPGIASDVTELTNISTRKPLKHKM